MLAKETKNTMLVKIHIFLIEFIILFTVVSTVP